ncbi:Otu Domain-Containing Protein 4 [Manis pentadactyla]|nr:Otu Domain-Containing Protein 4 [Manis pentadactyla]
MTFSMTSTVVALETERKGTSSVQEGVAERLTLRLELDCESLSAEKPSRAQVESIQLCRNQRGSHGEPRMKTRPRGGRAPGLGDGPRGKHKAAKGTWESATAPTSSASPPTAAAAAAAAASSSSSSRPQPPPPPPALHPNYSLEPLPPPPPLLLRGPCPLRGL